MPAAKTPTAKTAAPRKKTAAPAASTAPATGSLDSSLLRRVVVEGLHPEVDGGRFPIKRVTGETVVVNADVHADGHDVLAAALLYRKQGASGWTEVTMEPLGNDRWSAQFSLTELGRYEYTVEGWIDRFGSWRPQKSNKFCARLDEA
jgi:starch synthase (maltosyl-transferring)